MTRKTLDALMAAMDEHLDIFRRYLRLKGEVLGHKNGIPWYDMFAPMGTNTKKYTVEEAKAYLNLYTSTTKVQLWLRRDIWWSINLSRSQML